MARSAEPCELTASIVVACSVQQCWDVYIDNQLVADWAPAVTSVECDASLIDLNIVRKSSVYVDGKLGHTVEQCTGFEPLKRVAFSVIEETFGFSHMLTSYGFSVDFHVQDEHTLVIMQTHYVPKKIFASIMNADTTKQQILDLMHDTLQGFKQFTEAK